MTTTQTQAALLSAHWYSIDKHGAATLCVDEDDAKATAIDSQTLYPHNGPYRAVQMAPIEPAQAGELPPLPEPAAWRTSDEWPMCYQYTHEEPDEERISWAARYGRKHETVFTADQMHAYARAALAARKPLTDERINMIADRAASKCRGYEAISIYVAREVERAHGINGLEVKP